MTKIRPVRESNVTSSYFAVNFPALVCSTLEPSPHDFPMSHFFVHKWQMARNTALLRGDLRGL